MIIVKLSGGLGNQMFQYAAARRLATIHNAELKLDLSFLGRDRRRNTPREYELKHLKISAAIATPADVARIAGIDAGAVTNAMARLCRKVGLMKPNPNIFAEKYFHFDEALLGAPDNIYLDGYWQSEKYFKDIGDILREEFKVRYPLEGENLELAKKIKGTTSVSVHFRRGDYATNPAVGRYHGSCGLEYYGECVDLLCKKVSEPHFFIFSDEPEWAEGNLRLPHPATVVKHNGPRKGYEDLRLMALCRHNIIANSSFSWWGAWLNDNREKMVLAPEKWFNDPETKTSDLMPGNWIKI
jgi:hypothetical protein